MMGITSNYDRTWGDNDPTVPINGHERESVISVSTSRHPYRLFGFDRTCKTQWDKHQRREILGRRERW